MPMIRIGLAPGKCADQKIKYVEELTRLTADILKCPAESIDIVFAEVPGTSWAHAGRFLVQPTS